MLVRNVGCSSPDEGTRVQTNQGDMQYDDQMVIKRIEVQCCSVPM